MKGVVARQLHDYLPDAKLIYAYAALLRVRVLLPGALPIDCHREWLECLECGSHTLRVLLALLGLLSRKVGCDDAILFGGARSEDTAKVIRGATGEGASGGEKRQGGSKRVTRDRT